MRGSLCLRVQTLEAAVRLPEYSFRRKLLPVCRQLQRMRRYDVITPAAASPPSDWKSILCRTRKRP